MQSTLASRMIQVAEYEVFQLVIIIGIQCTKNSTRYDLCPTPPAVRQSDHDIV